MANVVIDKRDMSGPLALNGYRWGIERLRWKAVGGCDTARLRVSCESGAAGLWRLTDLLRCPLRVMDGGGPAWWGYVCGVEIHVEGRVASVSLDDMANRVAVNYAQDVPEPWTAARYNTSFGVDADSVRTYGEKERMFGAGPMSLEQATSYRTAMLARHGKPVVQLSNEVQRGERRAVYAILTARGWWDTLHWRYFNDTRGREGNLKAGLSYVWGDATARTKMAQGFMPAETWRTKEIWVKLAGAAPGDYLTMSLCARDPVTFVPSTVLSSATMLGNLVSQGLEWTRFELPAEVALTAGTLYWIVLSRSGAVHAVNNYRVGLEEGGLYSGGHVLESNGTGWAIHYPVADMSFFVLGREETSLHLVRMLASTAGGQFLAGVRLSLSTGVYGPTYRDGSTRAGEEIENILELGMSTGVRLLASVDAQRVLSVYTQPSTSAARVIIGRDGRMRGLDGEPLQLSEQPAGQWARLLALSPAGGLLGVQDSTWIEAVEWDGKQFLIVE